jgi:hypothetical protein
MECHIMGKKQIKGVLEQGTEGNILDLKGMKW